MVHTGHVGSGGPGVVSTDESSACYYMANTAAPTACVDGIDCYLYVHEGIAGTLYKSTTRCCELGEGPSGEGAMRGKAKGVPLDIMAKVAGDLRPCLIILRTIIVAATNHHIYHRIHHHHCSRAPRLH